MFIAFEDINLFSFHCLHFLLFLFTLKQREMTGETTVLSFFCVQTHTHTKERVFTAVSVVRVIMAGGLFLLQLNKQRLYINFTI